MFQLSNGVWCIKLIRSETSCIYNQNQPECIYKPSAMMFQFSAKLINSARFGVGIEVYFIAAQVNRKSTVVARQFDMLKSTHYAPIKFDMWHADLVGKRLAETSSDSVAPGQVRVCRRLIFEAPNVSINQRMKLCKCFVVNRNCAVSCRRLASLKWQQC